MPMTTAGRNHIAGLLAGTGTAFNAANAHLGVGDSATAFAIGQSDLVAATNKLRKAVTGAPNIAANVLTYEASFGAAEANFAWNEFGLFNAAAAGVMFSRVVSAQGTKAAGQTWELTYEQTIENGDS
jgi:hypothetical protein